MSGAIPDVRRRDVLVGGLGAMVGGAAVGGAGIAYAKTRDAGSAGAGTAMSLADAPPLEWFVSTRLFAPRVSTWTREGATPSAGLTFATPRIPLFRGVAWDHDGSPVWIDPDGHSMTDLRVQTYRGQRVLTYWTGLVLDGTGNGRGVLRDESYAVVAEVRPGNGVLADMHEFQLTSRGTALLTSYPTYSWDLSPVGGPTDGYVWGARLQEIDIATGEVVFDWEGLDHIDLEESQQGLNGKGGDLAQPWDPVHANSVEADGEDFLLMSARHTSACYKIDKRSGEIVWRMGGKRSDFEVPTAARFGWQHDLRRQPDGTLTIYDNHARAVETDARSAALRLAVDEERMTVRLVQALRRTDCYGHAMGNAQYLPDGHVMVGWGTDTRATEFDERGRAVWELDGLAQGSYRTYRAPWVGRPTTDPDVGVHDGAVFMSWNGATEVARWRVRAGASEQGLREVATVERAGFETSAPLDAEAAFVAVDALDAAGRRLGSSRTVEVARAHSARQL